MTFTARNHLILTPSLAATGGITPVKGRLADHLRTYNKPFLVMSDAEIGHLYDGTAETVPEVILPLGQIICAHEYVDTGGDAHMRAMSSPTNSVWVKTHISTVPGLVIEGSISESFFDWATEWIVVSEPTLTVQNETAARHAEALKKLPYLILNRGQVGALLKIQ